MARPVKRREGRGYEREIQMLNVLRTALVLDRNLDTKDLHDVLEKIDALILVLKRIIESAPSVVKLAKML